MSTLGWVDGVVRRLLSLTSSGSAADLQLTRDIQDLGDLARDGVLASTERAPEGSCGHRSAQIGCSGCVARVRRAFSEFPLQAHGPNSGPRFIPWPVAERAYQIYVAEGHVSQSLERLAERGGFSWGEMDRYFPGWREAVDERRQMAARVDGLELKLARLEQWLASEEEQARALPLGTAISGGPLAGAPEFDVRMRTVRLVRAVLEGKSP